MTLSDDLRTTARRTYGVDLVDAELMFAAADRLEELETEVGALGNEIGRLHYWLRCVDADTVSIRDDVATALDRKRIGLPS